MADILGEYSPTGRRSRGLRWIGAVLLIGASHGSWGGALEPTINIGAPGIVEMLNPLIMLDGGIWVENAIVAPVNASCNVLPSVLSASGRRKPNISELPIFSAPGAICHLDLANICESWIATNKASGSPSVYRRLTDPGFADSTRSSDAAVSAEIERHATTTLSRSVSNRALAASFSSVPARSPASILYRANSLSLSDNSNFKFASLMLPETTIAYVDTTPNISAPSNAQLAQKNTSSAGIPKPFLMLLLIVVLVVSGGVGVMIFCCNWGMGAKDDWFSTP
jgi:hypothetical protein